MKNLVLVLLILLVGCTKPELPTPEIPSKSDIFSVQQSSVYDGQLIYFNLATPGTYMLTLIDKETNQVISREKFIGKPGENIKRIYTNSLKSQSMYLLLEDFERKEIKKTVIIIKK
jgi:hypothetical protein